MAGRVYNFGAGPAMLPGPVLESAQVEFLDWQGLGASVIEVSHRSVPFMTMMEQAEQDLRDLLFIPSNYEVIFLQGGGSLQFAQVPMNLVKPGEVVSYLDSGIWARKAIKEAQRRQKVDVINTLSESGSLALLSPQSLSLDERSRYLHYCSNETINGIQYHCVPDSGPVPLIADMSSDFLSRQIDIAAHDLIYAGAQKNFGPAGMAVVIINKALLSRCPDDIPEVLNYAALAKAKSLLNTPPSFCCYIAGKVFAWLKELGGIQAIEAQNQTKASLLYDFIDDSDFYQNSVHPESRSRMNVPFVLADKSLEQTFLDEAQQRGLHYLKGHRSVGGMRASIYNAMPIEGVEALIQFMDEFADRHN